MKDGNNGAGGASYEPTAFGDRILRSGRCDLGSSADGATSDGNGSRINCCCQAPVGDAQSAAFPSCEHQPFAREEIGVSGMNSVI
jgi:hypothetical protein